jgi:hypothetical protein
MYYYIVRLGWNLKKLHPINLRSLDIDQSNFLRSNPPLWMDLIILWPARRRQFSWLPVALTRNKRYPHLASIFHWSCGLRRSHNQLNGYAIRLHNIRCSINKVVITHLHDYVVRPLWGDHHHPFERFRVNIWFHVSQYFHSNFDNVSSVRYWHSRSGEWLSSYFDF